MKTTVAALFVLLTTLPLVAAPVRIALFNTELSQDGPGLLLQRLERGNLPQAEAVLNVIAAARPDILVVQDFDWDLEGRALAALQLRLSQHKLELPFSFTARPNSGLQTELDMDGDGRNGTPRDAQGYGAFTGAHGMAVLSRYPLLSDQVVDLSDALWTDFGWAELPTHEDGKAFPSAKARQHQRLSSTNHWILPVQLDVGQKLDLMIFNATPPVFDGAEDRNGKRNHDEIILWTHALDGSLRITLAAPVVVIGDANLDPVDGDGRHIAINRLLSHPRLQDPAPASALANTATVDWSATGPLRVDYILPDARLKVLDAAVIWPNAPEDAPAAASRHRLVWVDVELP